MCTQTHSYPFSSLLSVSPISVNGISVSEGARAGSPELAFVLLPFSCGPSSSEASVIPLSSWVQSFQSLWVLHQQATSPLKT